VRLKGRFVGLLVYAASITKIGFSTGSAQLLCRKAQLFMQKGLNKKDLKHIVPHIRIHDALQDGASIIRGRDFALKT
jgi:hypothetical protein